MTTEYEQLVAANEARRTYLAENRVHVPLDDMYLVSLLEFALGDDLDEAKLHHERRIASILDEAAGNLAVLKQQAAEAQAQAQAEAEAEQRRQEILRGVHGG